ncbi:MAG: non-ribosomal peptide synthetase, partial [Dinghuibacter sp.]|nr:non-ribosomal peptide synthetase [Dinghuibacter sp.]
GKLLTQADSRGVHARIPIGRPFSATSVYVADKQLNLCPVGIPGELLIGGRGVSLGYLNKPELTSRQFIVRNYSGSEERLYRTGDLVRMLPDGQIEFLGRIDNQVKIRGHRIEPGDVETAIRSSCLVANVVVQVQQTGAGRKHLVGFIIPAKNYTSNTLHEHLLQKLPEYMIPARIMTMEEFPLTANGKIDRKKLLEMNNDRELPEDIVPPQNETEAALVAIWEKVLEYRGIGIHDNFFRIGGDSLLILKLKHELEKHFQTPVNIVDLFNKSTVAGQAVLFVKNTAPEEQAEVNELKF